MTGMYNALATNRAARAIKDATEQLAACGPEPVSAGRKDDDGKVRLELFPGDALFAISTVLTFGAKKYADRNWEKGMRWGRVFGALQRHLWAWWQGKAPTCSSFLFGDFDEETKMSHLWHAGCCLVFLITYEERKVGEDDRPTST